MTFILFEDDRWEDFHPVSELRHMSQLFLGRGTIGSRIIAGMGGSKEGEEEEESRLMGRNELAELTREETKLLYNEPLDNSTVLLVNARFSPLFLEQLRSWNSKDGRFTITHRGDLAVARLGKEQVGAITSSDGTVRQEAVRAAVSDVEMLETSDAILFRYPWEMIESNGAAITAGLAAAPPIAPPAPSSAVPEEDHAGSSKGAHVIGPASGLRLSPDAEIEDYVTFDTRKGPIVVEEQVKIESFSRISGPCFIGAKSQIHSALLRSGTSIGRDCRIGGEVEESILYPYCNKAHTGFVGHAIVGAWSNLGAGSVTSDLKNTYGTIKVMRGDRRIDSGMIKLGPMIGDMAKVSIGTEIFGGKTVGVATQCSGLIEKDLPDFVSFTGNDRRAFELRLESVILTQGRMMERRGLKLTEARTALIEHLHSTTQTARNTLIGAASEKASS